MERPNILVAVDEIGKDYESTLGEIHLFEQTHNMKATKKQFEAGGTIVESYTTTDYTPAIKNIINGCKNRVDYKLRRFAEEYDKWYTVNLEDYTPDIDQLLKHFNTKDWNKGVFDEHDLLRLARSYTHNATEYRIIQRAFPLIISKLPTPEKIASDMNDVCVKNLRFFFEELATKHNETWDHGNFEVTVANAIITFAVNHFTEIVIDDKTIEVINRRGKICTCDSTLRTLELKCAKLVELDVDRMRLSTSIEPPKPPAREPMIMGV